MRIHAHFSQWVILTHKVGHSDSVFRVQPGLISRSIQAGKIQQVYAWRLQFVSPSRTPRPTDTQTNSILTSLYEQFSQLS